MVISDPRHAECSNLTEAYTCYHENNVPSRLSPCCHKAIVVITGRAHCFHDNILYRNQPVNLLRKITIISSFLGDCIICKWL